MPLKSCLATEGGSKKKKNFPENLFWLVKIF